MAPALVRAEGAPGADAPTAAAPGDAGATEEGAADRAVQRRDRALALSAGLGIVGAYPKDGEPVNGGASGVYASAEYAFRASSWFSPRIYAGAEIAADRERCDAGVSPCDVTAEFAFAGAKARVLLPIPWVAPFVELGLGASLGHFSTRVGGTWDHVTDGLAWHVPWGFGLALGPHRGLELSFQFLAHPEQKQSAGGAVVGYRFGRD